MQIVNMVSTATMSIREIADLIEKQHSHIKVSAERLAEKGVIGTLATREFTHNGNVYTEYLLNKRDSLICEHGYQVRNDRGDYELTELGSNYGSAAPFATGKHSGYQILWSERTVEALAKAIGIKL